MPTTLYERRRHDDRARRRRRALNHLIDTANTLDDAIGFVRRAVPHSRAVDLLAPTPDEIRYCVRALRETDDE